MILDLLLLLCIVIIAVTVVSIIHNVCPQAVCDDPFGETFSEVQQNLTDTSDVEESQTMRIEAKQGALKSTVNWCENFKR